MLHMELVSIDQAIGSKLRGLRAERDLSQRDLATMSGVAESTIYRIERGERSARMDQLEPLCEALEVEVYDLVKAATTSLRAARDRG